MQRQRVHAKPAERIHLREPAIARVVVARPQVVEAQPRIELFAADDAPRNFPERPCFIARISSW